MSDLLNKVSVREYHSIKHWSCSHCIYNSALFGSIYIVKAACKLRFRIKIIFSAHSNPFLGSFQNDYVLAQDRVPAIGKLCE